MRIRQYCKFIRTYKTSDLHYRAKASSGKKKKTETTIFNFTSPCAWTKIITQYKRSQCVTLFRRKGNNNKKGMREEERIFSQDTREGPTATERKWNMIRAKENQEER